MVTMREASEADDRLVRLMVEYQAGRTEAFESLYAALAGALRRHFEAVARGEAADDLVQDTFMEIHRSRRTYLPPLPVRPWVFGIARNVLRRHRRVAWRRARRDAVAVAEDVTSASAAAAAAPAIDAGDVDDALRRLPPARRHAWELHHVHGLSFEEIARALRIPIGAARLRSSRAMGALRSALGIVKGEGRE
jgi:RNA polymerase sigma-70 factor (ECF subfamily)